MTSLLERELYRATALTFERLAFVFASPDSPKPEGYQDARLDAAVRVDFTGAFGGRMTLALYGGILPAIVGNMVGTELARDADSQADALGELANVICGNVLTGIAGGGETFLLGSPRPIPQRDVDRDKEKTDGTIARIRVDLESGAADVMLSLDRAVEPREGAEGPERARES